MEIPEILKDLEYLLDLGPTPDEEGFSFVDRIFLTECRWHNQYMYVVKHREGRHWAVILNTPVGESHAEWEVLDLYEVTPVLQTITSYVRAH